AKTSWKPGNFTATGNSCGGMFGRKYRVRLPLGADISGDQSKSSKKPSVADSQAALGCIAAAPPTTPLFRGSQTMPDLCERPKSAFPLLCRTPSSSAGAVKCQSGFFSDGQLA